jgi:hypothetical protein|tara:strand:+ start:38 stop:232 length:195 start_codon:yes stop_codon:yes gene_type:complete
MNNFFKSLASVNSFYLLLACCIAFMAIEFLITFTVTYFNVPFIRGLVLVGFWLFVSYRLWSKKA